MKNIAVLLLVVFIGGCVTGAPQGDSFSAVRDVPQGQSQLYLYRLHGAVGQALKYKVFIDGEQKGLLGNRGYIVIPVSPGKHEIELKAPGYKKNPVTFDFEAGENVFISAITDYKGGILGGSAKVVLTEVTKVVAEAEMTTTKEEI